MHNRQTIRLKDYDYTKSGAYAITLCTFQKAPLFGRTKDSVMHLSEGGEIARDYWLDIPKHYPFITVDQFVVMPNHFHGILVIDRDLDAVEVQDAELQHAVSRANQYQHIIPSSIGAIVRGYKIGVTKWFRENGLATFVWQRNFFEHIVRDKADYRHIARYIKNNVQTWQKDKFYLE